MQAVSADTQATECDVDALIVPYFPGREFEAATASLDQALGGALSFAREQGEVTGKFPERTLVRTLGRLPAPRVVLLGLGRPELLDGYRLRNALQFAARQTRGACRSLAVLVEPGLVSVLGGGAAVVAQAVAEGIGLGNYHVGQLKTGASLDQVEQLLVLGLGRSADLDSALARGARLAEAANAARILQWQPANQLTPTDFAEIATRLAAEHGLEIEVLEREDMERKGMGTLLSVARGSHQPPKLVALRYRSPGPVTDKVLALVGKGITFDTGGISLKPNPGMVTMKSDMSGAAAVLHALVTIADLGAAMDVMALAPLTENMPGGGATKPGDVVTAMNGRTVEINNTDAEGRLVLADALAYAIEKGATHLVDVATLTGSANVALGHPVTAAMGNDQSLLDQIRLAGERVGERVWQLPLYPEHDIALTCDIADIRNTSGISAAGTISGAIFLREFVAGRPWVHLDIAASSYHAEPLLLNLVPKGPTGVMTRTLAVLPELLAG